MEQFDWKKFLNGFIDPTSYFKKIAVIAQILIILLMCWGIYCLGVWIHGKVSKKIQQPSVFTVTGQQGGCVKNSADQKEQKFGLLNF